MKNIFLILGLFIAYSASADGHLKSEKDVLASLDKYFEARNNNDYATVVSLESKTGTYGTNSDVVSINQDKYPQLNNGKNLIKEA